jgi:membrane protein DedA with SNARE-associated domain
VVTLSLPVYPRRARRHDAVLGTQRLSYRRFIALDALNCLIWALVFGGLGYLFSSSLQPLIGEIRRLKWWLLLGLLGFAALLGLRYGVATKPYLKRGRQALE